MSKRQNRNRFVRVLFVNQDGRLLVVRQKNGARDTYCYPGGKVEEGETPQRAAAREIYEELGIRKSPRSLRPILRKEFLFSGVNWVGSFYLAVAPGFAPTLLEELKVHEVRFVSLPDLEFLDGDRESLVEVALHFSAQITLLTKQMRAGLSDGNIL